MSVTSNLPSTAIGYVYRTDCSAEGWSYIGQSMRLDDESVATYYGSGEQIRTYIARYGTEGLTKTILASADDPVRLHYAEMLAIATVRRDGADLLNGDFGGPRPFPLMQAALREHLPEAAIGSRDPERFLQLITKNRELVEQAIIDASGAPADQFYAGLERDLLSIEDLSHACPTCHALPGEVCRTNSSSLTKPRNPSRYHSKRPRQLA
ncbi:MAG: hypothetical protein V4737_03455 [Curtobacterium sp.]